MVSDIPTRSTFKQYKAAFASLTILAIVSVLYNSSSEDVVGSSRLLKKRGRGGRRHAKQARHAIKAHEQVIKRSSMKSVLGAMIKEDRKNPKEKDFVSFPRSSKSKLLKDHMTWLMSYPFGGAEETISLVEKATGKSMATNYGDEMFTADGTKHLKRFTPRKIQRLVKETNLGPFQNNAELSMAVGNIFVRTHCGGFCLYEPHIECTQKMYISSLTSDETWQDTCSWGKNAGKNLNKRYGQSLVNDVLVVLRDPKEIVAARFEDFVAMYGKYTYDEAGFLAYCQQVDSEHESYQQYVDIREGTKTSSFFDNNATVPCYTELTRIGMWSGRAITASRTRRNSLVVRHADLANPATQASVAGDILEFAGLKKAKPNVKFVFDSSAPFALGKDVSALMQTFISESYPESTKGYFAYPVPLNWVKIRGVSTQLAVSGEGQTIWLVNKPRNKASTFYRHTGIALNWKKNDWHFDFVAIDGSGLQLWAIKNKGTRTKKRYIVYKKHFGVDASYVKVREGLIKLAVDNQGNVWGIGVDRKCYYQPHEGTFSVIETPGKLGTITVSNDGLHVWVTTLAKEIFYKAGLDGDWIKVDGSMKYLSVTSDSEIIIGTNAANEVYYRKGLDGSWVQIPGQYTSATISGNGKYIWGTKSGRYTYYANSEKLLI